MKVSFESSLYDLLKSRSEEVATAVARQRAGRATSHFCSTCGLTRTGEYGHGLLCRLTLAGHSLESLVTGSVPETQGDWRRRRAGKG